MNQPAADTGNQSQNPEYQKNYNDCPKHNTSIRQFSYQKLAGVQNVKRNISE